jgi:hypothetical protein
MLAEIRAESGWDRGVGVFLFRQVESIKVGVGGDIELFFFSVAAQAKKEVSPVYLIDFGDKPANNFFFQLPYDSVDDKEVHGLLSSSWLPTY